MADWSRAGRNDWEEPSRISVEALERLRRVELHETPNRRTWWSVYMDGELLGEVRTTMGGYQWYREVNGPSYLGGMQGSVDDPDHAYAILALLDRVGVL